MRIRYRPRDLIRVLGPDVGQPLRATHTTSRPLVTDAGLRRRELDPYREAWSELSLAIEWGPSGNPDDPWGVRFTGPSRLTVTNPATPPRVYPGDTLYPDLACVPAAVVTPPTPGTPGYADVVLTDNPIGYWRLGDAAHAMMADSSGNGRHGTYAAGVDLLQASLLPGESTNGSAFFDATATDYAQVPYGAWANQTTHFTLEWIFRPTIKPGGSPDIVLARRSNPALADQAWHIQWNPAEATAPADGGGMRFIGINGANVSVADTVGMALVGGQVYHCAMTYNAGVVTFYVNGVAYGTAYSGAALTAVGSCTSKLTIGAELSTGSPGAPGRATIDEVAYYATALSAARIAAHYAARNNVATPGTPGSSDVDGSLTQGVTWYAGPTPVGEAVLAVATLDEDEERVQVNTEQAVPAGVTHVDVWVETDGAGWGVRDAGVSLGSATLHPATLVIRRGRSSEDAALEPSTVTTTLHLAGAPGLLTGEEVHVTVDLDELVPDDEDAAALGVRFVGRVTDVDAAITPGGPNTLPIVGASAVTALAGSNVGDTPWPQENALARARRILELLEAAEVLPVAIPGGNWGPDVAARDVDRQDASALLTELVRDTGLTIRETRAGVVTVDRPAPRDVAPTVTLTPDHIARPLLMPLEWGPDRVEVEYGTSADRRTLVVDTDGVAVAGTTGVTVDAPRISTQLANAEGAFLRARRELALGAAPVWRVRGLVVDVLRLLQRAAPGDVDVALGVLALEVGDAIKLDDLPLEAPDLAGEGLVVVLGVTETLSPTSWRFELAVVDAPAVLRDELWFDVETGEDSWLDVDPSITWAGQPAHL